MMQSFTSFLCNHCGASLQVQAETRFCTCAYCGTNLKVHTDRGTVYSEVLSELQERTKRIDENVQSILLHQEREALELVQEVEERRPISSPHQNGSTLIDKKDAAFVLGILSAIVIPFIGFLAIKEFGAPDWFVIVGLVFAVGGIVTSSIIYEKVTTAKAKKQVHHEKKEELLPKMDNSF